MTDDQTRSYENVTPDEAAATTAAAAAPAAQVEATPAPEAVPMAAVATPSRGGNRLRWGIALGVAALAVLLTVGALMLLGGSSTPEALKYVGADSAMVVEVRMDLPGDQMQKVGNLLAHFPGFADQSTLTTKIDEAFSRLVTTASDGKADYPTDVKPWLNGPLFLAGTPGAMDDSASDRRFVVAATTNGGVACDRTFEGQALTHETHRGVDLSLTAQGIACAVEGRFALVGDAASVRAALDASATGTGIDKSQAYLAARRQLEGEQLASLYVNGSTLAALAPSPDPGLPIPGMEALTGRIPEWIVAGARAEDDAIVVDAVTGPVAAPSGGPSQLPLPPTHASTLASLVPADTLLFVEDQGTGVSLQNLLATLRSVPEIEAQLQVVEGMVKPDELVGWVQDLGVAVSATGSTPETLKPEVTLLLVAADAAAATQRVTTVRTLLSLAALSGSEGIEVVDSTIDGVTVTNVTITDLGALLPPGSAPGVELPSGELKFAIAARDQIVYLAVGDGTLEKVLAARGSANLANDAAFKQAAQRALPNSRTTVYVAAGGGLDLVEPMLPAEIASRWTTDYKPYLDPIKAVGAWTSTDATGSRSRTVITVAGP